jgi:hypothetical protein
MAVAGLLLLAAAGSVVLPELDNALWATASMRIAILILAMSVGLEVDDGLEPIAAATPRGWGVVHRLRALMLAAIALATWAVGITTQNVLLEQARPGTTVPWVALTVEFVAAMAIALSGAAAQHPPARRHRGLAAAAVLVAAVTILAVSDEFVPSLPDYAPQTASGLSDPAYRRWVLGHVTLGVACLFAGAAWTLATMPSRAPRWSGRRWRTPSESLASRHTDKS